MNRLLLKFSFLFLISPLLFFSVLKSAYAVDGEKCPGPNATGACCTIPPSMVDGGGCEPGKYWIANACIPLPTACANDINTVFNCTTGKCDTNSTGGGVVGCQDWQLIIGTTCMNPLKIIRNPNNSTNLIYNIQDNSNILGTLVYQNPSGNVGIGTSGPSQKLDVDLGDMIVQGPDSFTSVGDKATVYIGNTNSWIQSKRSYGASYNSMEINTGSSIMFSPGGYSKVLFTYDGKVGIGDWNPSEKLSIDGGNIMIKGPGGFNSWAETAALYVGDTNNWIKSEYGGATGIGSYGSMYFAPGGSTKMWIGFDGSVGIGKTNPGYKLDIAGRMRIDSSDAGIWFEAGANDWFLGRYNSDYRLYHENYGDLMYIYGDSGAKKFTAKSVYDKQAYDSWLPYTNGSVYLTAGTGSQAGGGEIVFRNFYDGEFGNQYNDYGKFDKYGDLRLKNNYWGDGVSTPGQGTSGCGWSAQFSEENGGLGFCGLGKYVAGMQCIEDNCDDIKLWCCSL